MNKQILQLCYRTGRDSLLCVYGHAWCVCVYDFDRLADNHNVWGTKDRVIGTLQIHHLHIRKDLSRNKFCGNFYGKIGSFA